MNEPKDIEKKENGAGRSEQKPKPKKRPRVSQRKELAVVSIGMVAAITSFGGLLAGHQAKAEQAASTTPAAQVSSTTPGSSSGQSSNQQAPAYSSATQGSPAKASHSTSQGS